jgi:cytochrome c peroxidase
MAVRLTLARVLTIAALAIAVLTMAALAIAAQGMAEAYHWDLPKGFPKPRVPLDNPMSEAKARLGRYLFYDKRLSVNGAQSCATCHRQELAFTDGLAAPAGATGQFHSRSAMSLVNVAYNAVLTWSDPALRLLEKQAVIPMLGEHPVELGLLGRQETVLDELRSDPVYRELFPQSFPEAKDPFTIASVAKALAAFERTIVSARSPYDRYYTGGDGNAISDAAKRGEALFFSDPKAGCYRCHGGFNFSDTTEYEGSANLPVAFHNTGLYNLPGPYSYPRSNLGIYEHTRKLADVGKFKAPSLRNVALTAPYMHDGSVATLEDVLEHYAAGGRTIASGPYSGRGHDNPNKDARIAGIDLTVQNREDLLAFLRSLTDTEVLNDPRFSNPW